MQKTKVTTITTAALGTVLALSLPVTGDGVEGFIQVEDSGEAVMACLGPGFIACSIAGAFSGGGCVTIDGPIQRCVEAGGTIIGTTTSFSLGGGGTTGTSVSPANKPADFKSVPVSCQWGPGMSGGCLKIGFGGDVDWGCRAGATASSHGYTGRITSVHTPLGSFAPGTLRAPSVFAKADPCDLLVLSSAMTPLDFQKLIVDSIAKSAASLVSGLTTIGMTSPMKSETFASDLEHLDTMLAEWIAGVQVDGDYKITVPPPIEFEINVAK